MKPITFIATRIFKKEVRGNTKLRNITVLQILFLISAWLIVVGLQLRFHKVNTPTNIKAPADRSAIGK